MTHRVAVLGGRPDAVMYAKELGVDVVLVQESGKYHPDDFTVHCERVVEAPMADVAAVTAVLAPLHRERPFARVQSVGELSLLTAAAVSEALGVPGNSLATVQALKNKALTRAALARHGVGPVRHAVARSADDIEAFLTELGDRAVVKPLDAAGSEGVHILDDVKDVRAAWDALRAGGFTEAIVEEYLDGPEVSVEAFSAAGRHLTVAVNAKNLNDCLVEVGHTIPGDPGGHEQELRDLTVRLLDAVGLVEGPSHTEFVLTAVGPRILESHNRIAGGGVRELIRRVYGLNFSRMSLSVPPGIEELPPRPPEPRGGAAIRFFAPEPGLIRSISGTESAGVPVLRIPPGQAVFGIPGLEELADADAGIQLQMNPGDTVPPIRTGWDRRMGYAIASGPTAAAAGRRCEQLLHTVRIHTAPEPVATEGSDLT
jgi:biotin carboxylase